MTKAKRILWLINHTTLRKFEVNLLREQGYEVFTPKSFPYDEGNLSASVDYSYDDSLSIPKADLDILNSSDMYGDLSHEVVRIINKHFAMAFFAFFPTQLKELVRKFGGIMVMRPFGLATGATYSQITADELGPSFFIELQKVYDRFWFGQGYAHLKDVENGFYRQRAITLPVGLANTEYKDSWQGDKKRIYFVCPRISTSSFYRRYYDVFKDQFSDKYDYLIGGAQPIPVNDTRVVGYLNNEQYQELFTRSRVMFYHSQDRNHLHYHPFEAVRCGLPLVFMAAGMLDELGYYDLPGCARDQSDLHRKIARLMRGDKGFTSEIRKSQTVLLDVVSKEKCLPVWKRSIETITTSAPRVQTANHKKRILFCIPLAFGGGTMSSTKQMIKMFVKAFSDEWDVHFAHPKSDRYNAETLKDIIELGVTTKEFKWEILNEEQVRALRDIRQIPHVSHNDEHVVMTDGYNFLTDYDHVFFTTDRIPGILANDLPYSLIVQDVLQRYVPDFFGAYYENHIVINVRNAEMVFATTPSTVKDVIDYFGVKPSKVTLLPLSFSADMTTFRGEEEGKDNKYFVWTTNMAIHKNHIKMLDALEYYWLDEDGKLDCYVTGVDTDEIRRLLKTKEKTENPYLKVIIDRIRDKPILLKRIKIKGEMSKVEYENTLARAEFLVHPVLADNGTFCVVEAASFGVPSLSNDYPQMRYIDELFNLNMKFSDATLPERFSKDLKNLENYKDEWRNKHANFVKISERAWSKVWVEFKQATEQYFGAH